MKPLILIFLLFLSSIIIVNAQSTYQSLEEAIKADPKDVYRLEFDASEEEEWIEYISSLNYVKFMTIRNMKEFSPEILKLSSLSHLRILESSFTALPDVEYYSWMTSLRTLEIEAELTSLPETFGDFPNLEHLILYNNKFLVFPCYVIEIRSLLSLNLSRNQIEVLPDCLESFSILLELNLTYNQIAKISPKVANMQSIRHLDLGFNKISIILPEFTKLNNLEYLDLRNNPIKTLPNEFVNFSKETLIVLLNTEIDEKSFEKIKEINPNLLFLY